jgi:hypothetical protein
MMLPHQLPRTTAGCWMQGASNHVLTDLVCRSVSTLVRKDDKAIISAMHQSRLLH